MVAGGPGAGPELVDVDGDLAGEGDELPADHDHRRRDAAPGELGPEVVQALVALVGGGGRFELRPQQLHGLLAVEGTCRLEGEQLQQGLGLGPSPAPVEDQPVTGPQLEPAQHGQS